jgi:hypothetical protein
MKWDKRLCALLPMPSLVFATHFSLNLPVGLPFFLFGDVFEHGDALLLRVVRDPLREVLRVPTRESGLEESLHSWYVFETVLNLNGGLRF